MFSIVFVSIPSFFIVEIEKAVFAWSAFHVICSRTIEYNVFFPSFFVENMDSILRNIINFKYILLISFYYNIFKAQPNTAKCRWNFLFYANIIKWCVFFHLISLAFILAFVNFYVSILHRLPSWHLILSTILGFYSTIPMY